MNPFLNLNFSPRSHSCSRSSPSPSNRNNIRKCSCRFPVRGTSAIKTRSRAPLPLPTTPLRRSAQKRLLDLHALLGVVPGLLDAPDGLGSLGDPDGVLDDGAAESAAHRGAEDGGGGPVAASAAELGVDLDELSLASAAEGAAVVAAAGLVGDPATSVDVLKLSNIDINNAFSSLLVASLLMESHFRNFHISSSSFRSLLRLTCRTWDRRSRGRRPGPGRGTGSRTVHSSCPPWRSRRGSSTRWSSHGRRCTWRPPSP